MQSYELCVLFPGSGTQDENQEHAQRIEQLIKDAGADIKVVDTLGRKKLAYTIAGNTHAEYGVWLFEAEPVAVKMLNDKLRLEQSILRHLIDKLERVSIEERAQSLKDTKAGKSVVQEEDEEKPQEERVEKKSSPITEPKTVIESSEHKKDEKKISLEDLDEKLDEILESDKL